MDENQDPDFDPVKYQQFREDAWDLFEQLDHEFDGYLKFEELEKLAAYNDDYQEQPI